MVDDAQPNNQLVVRNDPHGFLLMQGGETTKVEKREHLSGPGGRALRSYQEPEDPAQASPLTQIPVEYKEYLHLFRKKEGKAALPVHQPWDHAIPIKPGKEVPYGPIYQLSQKELATLRQ